VHTSHFAILSAAVTVSFHRSNSPAMTLPRRTYKLYHCTYRPCMQLPLPLCNWDSWWVAYQQNSSFWTAPVLNTWNFSDLWHWQKIPKVSKGARASCAPRWLRHCTHGTKIVKVHKTTRGLQDAVKSLSAGHKYFRETLMYRLHGGPKVSYYGITIESYWKPDISATSLFYDNGQNSTPSFPKT